MQPLFFRFFISVFLCIFPILLFGCQSIPDAQTLLSFSSESFQCGFTVTSGDEQVSASLSRDIEGDTLTVTGEYSRVVYRFINNQPYLYTAASEEEAALLIPITLPIDCGSAYWRSLFCVLPTDTMQTTVQSGVCHLTDTENAYSAQFTYDGAPICISDGRSTVSITSFSFLPSDET